MERDRVFREVWIYDALGTLVDLFRIMPFQELHDESRAEAVVKCSGFATVLQDNIVPAEVTWTNKTVTQIVTDLLAYQSVARVSLGTIDAALNITVAGYRVSFDNLMKACWELRNVVGGYISVDPVAGTPTRRQLNLRATVGQDIGQRVQKGFNLRGVGKATDPTEAVTKIYALGRGEGNNQAAVDGSPHRAACDLHLRRRRRALDGGDHRRVQPVQGLDRSRGGAAERILGERHAQPADEGLARCGR